MKRNLFLMLLIGISFSAFSKNQKDFINFEKISLAQAKSKAQIQNIPIFMDVYATWCPPCKKLDREVFNSEEVFEFFNNSFINLKVDGEKEEQKLIESIDLEGYPTLIFFSASGEILHKHVGFITADKLVAIGKNVLSFNDNYNKFKSGTSTESFGEGFFTILKSFDPDAYDKYAKSELDKVSIEQLKNRDYFQNIFLNLVDDANNNAFNLAMDNFEELNSIHGDKFSLHMLQTYLKYKEQLFTSDNSQELTKLKKYQNTMEKILLDINDPQELTDLKIDIEYFIFREESVMLAKLLESNINEPLLKNKPELRLKLIMDASLLLKDNAIAPDLIKWAEESERKERNFNTVYFLSLVYKYMGNSNKAREKAKELLKIPNDEFSEQDIKDFINSL